MIEIKGRKIFSAAKKTPKSQAIPAFSGALF